MDYQEHHKKLLQRLDHSGMTAGEVDRWVADKFRAPSVELLTKREAELALEMLRNRSLLIAICALLTFACGCHPWQTPWSSSGVGISEGPGGSSCVSGPAGSYAYIAIGPGGIPPAASTTFRVVMKSASSDAIVGVRLYDMTSGVYRIDGLACTFWLSWGTCVSPVTSATVSMADLGDGWWECSITTAVHCDHAHRVELLPDGGAVYCYRPTVD